VPAKRRTPALTRGRHTEYIEAMNRDLIGLLVPAGVAVAAIALLTGWLSVGTVDTLQARVPGSDMPPGFDDGGPAELPEVFGPIAGDGAPADVQGDWPCFRGPLLDGICHDPTKLARKWPDGGPAALWSLVTGEGYAGAAIHGGRVFLLDYDREAGHDLLRCLSLADGREIWRTGYPVSVKRNHGMSRTVPAVTEKYTVTFGPKCHVMCIDTATGKPHWIVDLVSQFGAEVPPWYAGQCPIIVDDTVVLAPGGDALMVALDCATGDTAWKTVNLRSWTMTHTSIAPLTLGDRPTYVYCGKGGVAGVDATNGNLLWDSVDWKISIATCPSPTILDDGHVFFSGGYNAGALLMQLEQEGERIVPRTVERFKPAQFGSTQHTPILHDGFIYGVRERDKQLVCLDQRGREQWSSGSRNRFGLGPYLIADGLIFVLDDDGELTLAEATPDGYKQLDRVQVLDDHDCWAPMAMAEGRLIVRGLTKMVCLDVRKP